MLWCYFLLWLGVFFFLPVNTEPKSVVQLDFVVDWIVHMTSSWGLSIVLSLMYSFLNSLDIGGLRGWTKTKVSLSVSSIIRCWTEPKNSENHCLLCGRVCIPSYSNVQAEQKNTLTRRHMLVTSIVYLSDRLGFLAQSFSPSESCYSYPAFMKERLSSCRCLWGKGNWAWQEIWSPWCSCSLLELSSCPPAPTVSSSPKI